MKVQQIHKGTRHQKVIGQFGEHLICNWLSRSGFEATIVDHTGIDIVAYNPANEQRLGISVKARTRSRGTETSDVRLFVDGGDRKKLLDACVAFGCEPWLGIYVETTDGGDLYLVSLLDFDSMYTAMAGRCCSAWRMTSRYTNAYSENAAVCHVKISFDTRDWRFAQADAIFFAGEAETPRTNRHLAQKKIDTPVCLSSSRAMPCTSALQYGQIGNAEFIGASVQSVDFRKSDLKKVDFTNGTAYAVSFSNVKGSAVTI